MTVEHSSIPIAGDTTATAILNIVYVDESTVQSTLADATPFLDSEDVNHIERQKFARDKSLLIGSRLLSRFMISESCKIPIDKVQVIRSGGYMSQKPRCGNDDTIDFNISHDGTVVLGILSSSGKVGVDVMKLQPRWKNNRTEADFYHSMRRVFQPEEWVNLVKGDPVTGKSDLDTVECWMVMQPQTVDKNTDGANSRSDDDGSNPMSVMPFAVAIRQLQPSVSLRLIRFMACWTIKEAWLKHQGTELVCNRSLHRSRGFENLSKGIL